MDVSGSSLLQGARQIPDGYNVQCTLDWGPAHGGGGERKEQGHSLEGGGTACDPPLRSNRNVGKTTWFSGSSVRPFPGACLLVSWLCGRPWPLAFCSGSV